MKFNLYIIKRNIKLQPKFQERM